MEQKEEKPKRSVPIQTKRERPKGTTNCPRCGNGRTGTGGGFRYCPNCGWNENPDGVSKNRKVRQ